MWVEDGEDMGLKRGTVGGYNGNTFSFQSTDQVFLALELELPMGLGLTNEKLTNMM